MCHGVGKTPPLFMPRGRLAYTIRMPAVFLCSRSAGGCVGEERFGYESEDAACRATRCAPPCRWPEWKSAATAKRVRRAVPPCCGSTTRAPDGALPPAGSPGTCRAALPGSGIPVRVCRRRHFPWAATPAMLVKNKTNAVGN